MLDKSILALLLCANLLSACVSSDTASKVSAGIADSLPVWAGGEPRDAPPRPGTPEYDAWMAERTKEAARPKNSANQN